MLDGAVHATVTKREPAEPRAAVTEEGAPGTVRGVSKPVAVEAVPLPTAFVATTLNVYAVPFVSPVIVHARVETDAGLHVFAGDTAVPVDVYAVTA